MSDLDQLKKPAFHIDCDHGSLMATSQRNGRSRVNKYCTWDK